VRVKVDGKSYLAAECAWLWMTGEWPTRRVIHLDGNVKNDCWSNLELKPLDRPQPFSAQGSMEEELSKLGLI
jgi:hypothetical protein